jgi:hypothetical protein
MEAAGYRKACCLFDSASPKSPDSCAIILQYAGNSPVTYQMTSESYNQKNLIIPGSEKRMALTEMPSAGYREKNQLTGDTAQSLKPESYLRE